MLAPNAVLKYDLLFSRAALSYVLCFCSGDAVTTLVMVKKAGVVSIAGDSQSTFGETRVGATYDARYNKIFRLDDNFIAVSGSAAHDLVLQSALVKLKNRDLSSRLAIFETFRKLHHKLKEDYFLNTEEEDNH